MYLTFELQMFPSVLQTQFNSIYSSVQSGLEAINRTRAQLNTVSCSSLTFTLCSNQGEVIKHLEHEIMLSVEPKMLKS